MAAKGAVVAFVWLRSESTGAWLAHPELRTRMVADAEEKGTNLTDLAVRILSNFFNVPYETRRWKSTPKVNQNLLNFGCSQDLKNAIVRAYPQQPWLDSIRYVLCAHYGLPMPAKVKATRKRRAARAAA